MSKNTKITIYAIILVIMLIIGSFFGRSLFEQDLQEGDAVEYNNFFVTKQNEVITQLQKVEKDLPNVLEREEGDKIISDATDSIDSVIKEVEAREAIRNGEELKKTAISSFQDYKAVVEEEYPKYLDIIFAETQPDADSIDAQFKDISEEIKRRYSEADNKFIDAQENFATKTGIILQGR